MRCDVADIHLRNDVWKKKKAHRCFKKKCGNSLPTLEDGGILNDKTLELSADHLQTRFQVAACCHQVALLHLLGAAGLAFGLANLQV